MARVVASLVLLAAVVALVVSGWEGTYRPAGIPSRDVADYVARALVFRDAWVAGDGMLDEALRPDLHPPGHALVLGTWFAAAGASIASACRVGMVEYVAALLALVWLGHRADPGVGALAGLGAAALTAASLEHTRLSAVPMTENLALLALILALGARRPLVGGVAICAATLVRYNLAPMLLAAVIFAHLAEHRGRRLGELVAWVAPTALLFAAWSLARPELPAALRAFFTNVDSGLPLASRENLLWVPTAFSAGYAGNPWLAAVVGGLFLVGLAGRRDRLAFFVLVGVVAMTVHPYKLTRAVHGVVPVLYLAAMLALARARPVVAVPVAAALAGLLYLRPSLEGRLEVADEPGVVELLDGIVRAADGSSSLVLAGGHPVIGLHVIEVWYRLGHPGARVLRDVHAFGPGAALVVVERGAGEGARPGRDGRRRDGTIKPERSDASRREAESAVASAQAAGGVEAATFEVARLRATIRVLRAP